jgi:hypothetical protein
MRLKTQRRAIYAAMGLTVVSLIGGFAIASINIGQTATSGQGTESITVGPIVGLNFGNATIEMGPATVTNCDLGTGDCDIGLHNITTCIGGVSGHTTCAATDVVEQVTLYTVKNVAMNPVNITISGEYTVGGVATPTTNTIDVFQTVDTAGYVLTVDFDLGPSPAGSVTAIDLVFNSV